MIPILYSANETAFTNNGLGFLADATACEVEHEVNGQFELAMTYPVTGVRYSDIKKEEIILADADPYAKAQPFRIYRIAKPLNGLVKIYARHIAYDMQGIPVSPFTGETAAEAVSAMGASAVIPHQFTFETDVTASGAMENAEPTDLWTLLGSSRGGILSVYGGEWEFDRFTARLKTRLGADRGVELRYGLNLTSMEQDDNCDSVYTGVYPFWASDDTLVTLDEKTLSAEGTFEKEKILPLDLSSYFSAEPTQEELRAAAQSYMTANEVGVPQISWKVSYVQLSQTAEYKDSGIMDNIGLGDSVTVIFPKMGINATSRVVKIQYNVLLDRCESISIGAVKKTISDTIAEQSAAISSLGGGVAAAQVDIEGLIETAKALYDEVALKATITDLNSAIARVGTVEAGIDAIVKANGYDPTSDSYDRITAWTSVAATIGKDTAGLTAFVEKLGYDPTAEDYSSKEAYTDIATAIGDTTAGLKSVVTALGGTADEAGNMTYSEITAVNDLKAELYGGTQSDGTAITVASSLTQRVSKVIEDNKTTTESVEELTTKVGEVESGLSTKVETSTLDGYLTKTAAAELYATDDDVTALIGAYVLADNTTLASIKADLVEIASKKAVINALSITENTITTSAIFISGSSITANKLTAVSELQVGTSVYSPSSITSTTGTEYTVLGAA